MYSPIKGLSVSIWHLCRLSLISAIQTLIARLSYFVTEWVLSTNHRRIAVLYFFFVLLAGFTGLILATIIRLELANPLFGLSNQSVVESAKQKIKTSSKFGTSHLPANSLNGT
jgi:hypothetical protein